jgi:hypothetical protein
MNERGSKLSLQDVTAIGREVVGADDYVIGTIPSEGDSEYAELVVALHDSDSSTQRLSIGVHRSESAECIREQIARFVRARA